MKKLILGTAAVIVLGLSPAYAEDHGHATEAASPVTDAASVAAETVQAQTVADVVAADPRYNMFVGLLQGAGMIDTLKGEGPFTVFAPVNDAFLKLEPSVLADLSKPENAEKLQNILKYHVVPGKIAAADAKGAAVDLTTVQSGVLKVDGTGEQVKVGDALVVQADVAASNGLIHAIDTVLTPPVVETTPAGAAPAEAPKAE
ncbi:MAG: fasciclin domain-containing protein [Micavibrio aeruginosavorus]|uniref:Fasciclin domain-containing protein n=1 Tax=Micavibrio aeruginosavorus TaxID=349221 RepID=A0A7T5R2V7_9BACT|nr:MAG: fasciclin domain-containing protein [Micavibrio aeruginosavorus]